MKKTNMSPVLKWAGGKRQLLPIISEYFPKEFNTYYEPFIGGGAVLFSQAPDRAVINDANPQLINLYRQIKSAPDEFIRNLEKLDAMTCSKELYYEMRAKFNKKLKNQELDPECAAVLVWINKHAFNGLYKISMRKHEFNVPFNYRLKGASFKEDNVRAISEYLNLADVDIRCEDFETLCENVGEGDFVYLDPPYVPETATAKFTNYTSNGFQMEDHLRLAKTFRRLDERGTKVMLSNNDVPLVRELFDGYNIISFPAKRLVNRDATKRMGQEVLIMNY